MPAVTLGTVGHLIVKAGRSACSALASRRGTRTLGNFPTDSGGKVGADAQSRLGSWCSCCGLAFGEVDRGRDADESRRRPGWRRATVRPRSPGQPGIAHRGGTAAFIEQVRASRGGVGEEVGHGGSSGRTATPSRSTVGMHGAESRRSRTPCRVPASARPARCRRRCGLVDQARDQGVVTLDDVLAERQAGRPNSTARGNSFSLSGQHASCHRDDAT